MKKIPKKIVKKIIDLFVNSGRAESCHYEYREGLPTIEHRTIIYHEPRLLWFGSHYPDYSSKALLFFYDLEENYTKYANNKEVRDDYNKKILGLYIEYFSQFRILDPYIPVTDELVNKIIDKEPYRIYEIKNPKPKFIEKVFNLDNDIVLSDSFDENALFPMELKMKILHSHPNYINEICLNEESYIEVECYRMAYKADLKNVDKLCKNVAIVRDMETEEDESGMSFMYLYLIKKNDDVNDVFTKDEICKICDKERESQDLPIMKLLMSSSDEDYLDLMRYLKSRYKRFVADKILSSRWNYGNFIFMQKASVYDKYIQRIRERAK